MNEVHVKRALIGKKYGYVKKFLEKNPSINVYRICYRGKYIKDSDTIYALPLHWELDLTGKTPTITDDAIVRGVF